MYTKEEKMLINILERQRKEKETIKKLKMKIKKQKEQENFKRWQKIGETIEKTTGIMYDNDTLITELADIIKREMDKKNNF